MSDQKPWVYRSDKLWREANRKDRPGLFFWLSIGFGWGITLTLISISLMRAG